MQRARRPAGFSLLELLVALLVATILMAVALPYALRAYRWYQLTNAAHNVADILRLTRYEAIRLNKPVNCVIQPWVQDPTMTSLSMTDSLGNPITGIGSGTTMLLGAAGNLTSPPATPIPGLASLGTVATMAAAGGTIQFDRRGAVSSTNVNAFYLDNAAVPDAGYRAVLLMPAGSIQIWSADSSGNWQEQR